jgi:hypothetical protein
MTCSAPQQKQEIPHRDRKDRKDLTILNLDQACVDFWGPSTP